MRKIYTKLVVLLLLTASINYLYAQVPQGINFQAIARDANSEPMANTNIQIQLSILDDEQGNAIVYQELRSLMTNDYGSFSFQIGVDPHYVTIGVFSEIDWASGSKSLQMDYDPTNTFTFDLTLGTIQFATVPYAFVAQDVIYIDITGVQDGDILIYNIDTGKFEPNQMTALSPTLADVLAQDNDGNNLQIKNIADPTDGKDAVNKDYVDALIADLQTQIDAITPAPFQCGDDITYQGYDYSTVEIGTQCWFAENLRTTKYNDDSDITLVTDNTAWGNLSTEAYCWYQNDETTYGSVYGALYNWFAVETGKLCPDGWSVPSDDDWKELEMAVGMSQADADATEWRGTNEGSKLAGGYDLWTNGNLRTNVDFDDADFSVLPGGARRNNGTLISVNNFAYLWSSTGTIDNARHRRMDYNNSAICRLNNDQKYGFSVRCVRD
jgi:uncharacterized protein (TIGR02145 family)